MKQNNKWLFFLALLMGISVFLLSPGNAVAQGIDNGYVGTAVCLGCHDGVLASDKTSFIESGHSYKFRQTNGADCTIPLACDAISSILPTPSIATIDTISTTGVVDLTIGLTDIVAPIGDLDWKDIDAVIGGWGWKSRYVALDTGGLLGGNAPSDETGLVWSGTGVQWNVFTMTWGGYHAGENKVYNCSRCHNTNGTRNLGTTRALLGFAAYGSQHTYDGVQCEGCHADSVRVENGTNHSNGWNHSQNPLVNLMGVADGAESGDQAMCGRCHNRDTDDEPNLSGAAARGGFIRHHEQYDELVGVGGTGAHASLDCGDCHNPHIRSHKVPAATATALGISDNALSAEARGAVVTCQSCHGSKSSTHTSIMCIDCHMAEATKSATAVTGAIGKKGDVKTHIFTINPDELAADTAAGTVAEGYLSLNYACAKCHDASMTADYSGIPLSIAEMAVVADNYHVSPVSQNIGMPDTTFDNLVEAECRLCHEDPLIVDPESVPDRHHLLMNSAISVGECSTFNGTCSVTTTQNCQSDSDCPATETCIDDGTDRSCVTDADCAAPRNLCNIRGQDCPVGTCSVTTTTACSLDSDCPASETCDVGGCPQSYTGQVCGQPFCQGGSAAQDPDANNDGTTDTDFACLNCHTVDIVGGIIEMVVFRDCAVCHVKVKDAPTVHHNTPTAKGGDCVACHGDLVDNPIGCTVDTCSNTGAMCSVDADCDLGATCLTVAACDDGHAIPTYAPSLVTPEPSNHAHQCVDTGTGTPVAPQVLCVANSDCAVGNCSVTTATACNEDTDCPAAEICVGGAEFCEEISPDLEMAGGCAYCHNAGLDATSGIEVVDNHDTHHGSGIYKNRLGGTDDPAVCVWCHAGGNPHAPTGHGPDRIRWCENCHGYESLHNIQGDADGDGTIDVGGELKGAGHIGNNDDCWGCHGFLQADAAPGSGELVPTISSSDVLVTIAGTDTVVNLTGSAFTNTYLGMFDWTSVVRLTASDGSTTILTPDSISESSITVTIPGTVAAGNYDVAALKGSTASNTVVLSVKPEVVITDSSCNRKKGVLTVSGSGFGEKPAGTDDYISVQVNGQSVDIISWSDTRITASVSKCSNNADITVDAVMGSATSGSSGGGKPDKPCKGKKCN